MTTAPAQISELTRDLTALQCPHRLAVVRRRWGLTYQRSSEHDQPNVPDPDGDVQEATAR